MNGFSGQFRQKLIRGFLFLCFSGLLIASINYSLTNIDNVSYLKCIMLAPQIKRQEKCQKFLLHQNITQTRLFGALAFQSGKYDEAVFIFQKLQQGDPANEIDTFWLAYSYYQSGDMETAIEYWQKLGPAKMASYFARVSDQSLRNHQNISALNFAKLSVEIDPTFAAGYYQLGMAQYEMNSYKEAESSLQYSLKLGLPAEDLGNAFHTLGNIYLELHQSDQVINAFEQAVLHSPDSYLFRRDLADRLTEENRFDDALYHLNVLLDKNQTDSSVIIRIGNVYLDQGKFIESEKWFRLAVSVDPASGAGEAALGRLYTQQGDMNQAETYFHKSLDLDPQKYWVWLSLGSVYWQQGQIEKAIEAYTWVFDHAEDPFLIQQAREALSSLKSIQKDN